MVPNFLIAGVQKGATTWLSTCLGQHPDIFVAEEKELFFFNRHFDEGLMWYERHFRDWSDQKAVGEATPGYIYDPEVPGRIKQVLGDEIKLIVSLRHPVDRAYSAFWMFLGRGRIPVDADFRTYFYEHKPDLRDRGYYYAQLKRYLEYFPLQNLHILIYEEMKQDDKAAIRGCFEFLGVDPQFLPEALYAKVNPRIDVSVMHNQFWAARWAAGKLPRKIYKPLDSIGRRIFTRLPKQKKYRPLSAEIRQELLQNYMIDIKQLEDLLGRDLSIWYGTSKVD